MKEVTAALNFKSLLKRIFQNLAAVFVQIAFLAVPFLLINFSFSSFLDRPDKNVAAPNQVKEQGVQQPEVETSPAVKADRDIEELIIDANFDALLVNNERP